MSQFQQAVNIYNPPGIPGGLAFAGPTRTKAVNIASSGVPNNFGYFYTLSAAADANPSGAAPNGETAQVGGTGAFGGFLVNPKENALYGSSSNPLAASNAIPDNSIGELLTMGMMWVTLPGPANPGDLVTYDPATGALNSIKPVTQFTGSIAAGGAATPDVLTVTAVAAGELAVGQLISGGTTVGGTFIQSFGTGKGGTGTYNLSTINQQTVSSAAMTATDVPVPAFSVTATFATNVMTVASVVSGRIEIGSQIFGAGIPANTVVTAFGTGVGGTGTYTLNQTVGTITPAIAVTGPANLVIPNAVVERYAPNSAGGLACIKVTN